MPEIQKIDDAYIDAVIKASEVYNPNLGVTQGVRLRELIKLMRDQIEQQGENDATGAEGLSAYQIWLRNGNAGTEADFLASLKGAKGDKGDSGNGGTEGSLFDMEQYVRGAPLLPDQISRTPEFKAANASYNLSFGNIYKTTDGAIKYVVVFGKYEVLNTMQRPIKIAENDILGAAVTTTFLQPGESFEVNFGDIPGNIIISTENTAPGLNYTTKLDGVNQITENNVVYYGENTAYVSLVFLDPNTLNRYTDHFQEILENTFIPPPTPRYINFTHPVLSEGLSGKAFPYNIYNVDNVSIYSNGVYYTDQQIEITNAYGGHVVFTVNSDADVEKFVKFTVNGVVTPMTVPAHGGVDFNINLANYPEGDIDFDISEA